MRNTLVLDDELVRQAKKLAAEQDTTLGEIVNRALRAALAASAEEAPRFAMVTFGGRGPETHHEPADLARLLEDDDLPRRRRSPTSVGRRRSPRRKG